MLKVLFPFRIQVPDADGILRPVANMSDVVDLAKEKAERYNDEEAKRFIAEVEASHIASTNAIAAQESAQAEAKPAGKGVKALIPDSATAGASAEVQAGEAEGGEEEQDGDDTPPVAAKKPAAKKPAAKKPAAKKAAAKKAAAKKKPARKR